MKSKKGGVMDSNLIGTIIAVAVVFVLLVLLFNLFAPSFDKAGKTAESYFESLERAIEMADSGGVGDFFMIDNEEDDLEFYLVYFGSVASFKEGARSFTRSKQGEKVICVCYRKRVGDTVCNYCEDLELPVKYIEGVKVVKEGVRVKIAKSKDGEHYEFTKI